MFPLGRTTMEEACEAANLALYLLIRALPSDIDGEKGEMRACFCEAQDWLQTLYAELKAEKDKAMEECKKNVTFCDKIEHVSEGAPRNEVIWKKMEEIPEETKEARPVKTED